MGGSVRRFLEMTPVERLQALAKLWYRLRTVFLRSSFASLGKGSVIGRFAVLKGTRFIWIGDRVHIRGGVRLEVCRTASSPRPELWIGDDSNLEQNVHIVCHNRVRIGRNVIIAANCAIVDTSHDFRGRARGEKAHGLVDDNAEVVIGDGAFLGVGAVILPGVHIGANAVIGANSVVTHDVAEGCVAAGVPARVRYTASHQTPCVDVSSSEAPRLPS